MCLWQGQRLLQFQAWQPQLLNRDILPGLWTLALLYAHQHRRHELSAYPSFRGDEQQGEQGTEGASEGEIGGALGLQRRGLL